MAGPTRYRRRADKNQPEIVEAFRARGAKVFHTHTIGRGFPDLFVDICGECFLIEVKASAQDKLTTHEKKFAKEFNGDYLRVVHSIEQVDALVNAVKRKKTQ